MKLDAAYVKRIADATGFDAVQLEKVIRLRQLTRPKLFSGNRRYFERLGTSTPGFCVR